MEGSCCGLIEGYVLGFACRNCGHPTKSSKCSMSEPRVEPGRAASLLNRTAEPPEHK